MKRTLYLALLVVIMAACKKDQTTPAPVPPPEPVANSIYGQWDLYATAKPFSTDTTWKYVRKAEDMISISLLGNGTYVSFKHPDRRTTGTFTVADSANTNIKKVTLYTAGEPFVLYLQMLAPQLLKVDDETIKASSEGYISQRFARRWVCTVLY